MKTLLPGLAVLLLLINTNPLRAQVYPVKKQQIFKNASDRVPVAIAELEKAFKAKEGTNLTFQFRGLELKGTLLSSVKRYENLYSVIVKSSSDDTLLSFSKRINDDLSVTYIGRILNDHSSDGYELKKNTDGSYTFHKIQTEDLIQDF